MAINEIKKKQKIDKDTDIEVTSNVRASFGYLDKKSKTIDLDNHGDSDYITFGELKSMASGKHKKTLHNMYILITDIEDPEFTVDDVIEQLRLNKYYDAAKKVLQTEFIDSDTFDDFVENSDINDILKAVKNDNLISGLTESAVELHKNGKIELEKTKAIFEACGVSNFYEFISDLSK